MDEQTTNHLLFGLAMDKLVKAAYPDVFMVTRKQTIRWFINASSSGAAVSRQSVCYCTFP